MDPTVTDDEPKAEITRCICGHEELQPGQIHNLHRQRKNFDPDFFIQCDNCHVWQHGYCVGILNDQEAPEGYYCEKCRPDYHVIVVRPSGRTSKYSPQEYSDEEEEEEVKAPPPKEKEFTREERASRQRKEKEVTLQEPDQEEPSRTANSSSAAASRRDRKRRLTVNSTRDEAAYEETLRRVLEESVHDDEHRDAKAALEAIKSEAASATTALAPPATSTTSTRNRKRRTDSPSGSDESTRTSASFSKRATKASNGNSNNNGNSKQASTPVTTTPSSVKGVAAVAAPASPSPQAAISKKSEKRKRRHNASDDHSGRATSLLHTSGATTSASGKSYIDKPSKPRIPQSRISIPEMQKRVAAILEFIARTRLDLAAEERERRQLLDIRLVRYNQLYKPGPTEGSGANGTASSNLDPDQDSHLNDPKFGGLVNGFSKSLALMDTLTAKLSDWEQRYGAYDK